MITFLICLTTLISAYFFYSKYVERAVGIDTKAEPPCKTHYDGVDYLPLPHWKAFLIQLLNIAGLGPIFGAILGAMYGPMAFLWITLGGIFIGSMHDYVAGMISMQQGGLSLPEIIGRYLGSVVKQCMRGLTLILMILVGAVFLVGPAGILESLTGWNQNMWVGIILTYYILATLLPIDKIMGRIYPLFGAALFFMALGILGVLLTGSYPIPELSPENWHNFKLNAEQFPIFPTLCITIACGAISGFHATQSPLMARCLVSERLGRPIFFGAMISESVIALIWAAIGMAFWGGVEELNTTLGAHKFNAAWAVDVITHTTLGRFGAVLAMLGVVIAPITSGDSAFRSARLIAADFLHFDQKPIRKRLYLSIPLFVVGFAITLMNFGVLWQYFAWINQLLAAITLWAITVYLINNRRNYHIALYPALFMTQVVVLYILIAPEGFQLPYWPSFAVTTLFTLIILTWTVRYIRGCAAGRITPIK